jgi:hypothetical protein
MANERWSPEYAERMKETFYEFLSHTWVKSKELGWITLSRENLYGAQVMIIETIFEGLGRDIHDFKILKSRQLGSSTIIRALGLFWLGVFEMTGSLLFDTAQHLDEARQELIDMLERMPESFKFPRKARDNRYSLSLENRSRINLLSVGVKESKGGKALGSSSAIAFAHRSELCSYGNTAGLEGYRHSLARTNPNRLFIDESTAKGYGYWHEVYEEGKKDHRCITLFAGWWSHPSQKIDRDDPDFAKYGLFPCTREEIVKIRQVKAQYGHDITPEQLAWIRREMNPTADVDGDAEPDFTGDAGRLENQPWTEEDAWQMTGAVFFDSESLGKQAHTNVSRKYKTYSYVTGTEFTDFRVFPAPNQKSVQLKVWEEPVEESVYVVAADVAFGHSEYNDRSAVQVLRCFADGIDQVAEYAWPLIDSRQFAWVIASLEGWYAGDKSEVYRIIEINGPGEATWRELVSLRQQLRFGYFGKAGEERGLARIQQNVRNYFYTRSDSMTPGHAAMWKTTQQLKVAIFERLRDFTNNGMLRIRSQETLEECRTITRDGDSIEAQGSAKDDRVFSLALGVRCWDERARRGLITAKRTREYETARRRLSIIDQHQMFRDNLFQTFLNGQQTARRRALQAARRNSWGSAR